MPSEADFKESAGAKLLRPSVRKSLSKQIPDFETNPETQKKIFARFVDDAKRKAQKAAAKAVASGQTVLSSDGSPLSTGDGPMIGLETATADPTEPSEATSLEQIATTPTTTKSKRQAKLADPATTSADIKARYERNAQRGKPKVDVFADTPADGSTGEAISLTLSFEDMFSLDRPEGNTFSAPGKRSDGKDALTVTVSHSGQDGSMGDTVSPTTWSQNSSDSILPPSQGYNKAYDWSTGTYTQFQRLGDDWYSTIGNTVHNFAKAWKPQADLSGWNGGFGQEPLGHLPYNRDTTGASCGNWSNPWRRGQQQQQWGFPLSRSDAFQQHSPFGSGSSCRGFNAFNPTGGRAGHPQHTFLGGSGDGNQFGTEHSNDDVPIHPSWQSRLERHRGII